VNENFSGILIPEGGECHEAQTIFGRADRVTVSLASLSPPLGEVRTVCAAASIMI
jgi:hypothetical protein